MKRYLLFAFDTYYPAGGWDDFLQDFDTQEEAALWIKQQSLDPKFYRRDTYELVDTETKEQLDVTIFSRPTPVCDNRLADL